MNSKSNKCACCKKIGHNITTCVSAVKQGILIENHILEMKDTSISEIKFRIRLLQYLRNLSKIQQKILCTRIGETNVSYSNIVRYLSYKWKSRKVMNKIYGKPELISENILSSFNADKISSPTFSEKAERKKYIL